MWLPDKLERQLADMENRELTLFYTSYYLMNWQGEPTGKEYRVPPQLEYGCLLRENVIGCSTAVFRQEVAAGLRMRGDYAHEDYVFWLELMGRGCVAGGIDRLLMGYRVHPSSRSADKSKATKERWRIYRKFLGLPMIKSLGYFLAYGIGGIRKHW